MNRCILVSLTAVMLLAGMTQAQGTGGRREPVAGQTDPNLVGWWKLDEAAGTIVKDSSGNGIDGSFVGTPQWVTGVHGGALLFDGASAVSFGNPVQTVITGPLTIACWINPSNLGTTPSVPGGSQDRAFLARDGAYALKATGPRLRFTTPWVRDHDAGRISLKLREWQHVAVTFQPNTAGGCVFYLDAVESDRMDASRLNAGTGPVRIAVNQWAGQSYTGMIDDVRLYRRILTETEIREVMEDTWLAREPQPPDGAGVGLQDVIALSWTAGDNALMHDVYLGMNEEAVRGAGPMSPLYWGRQTDASFFVAGLLEAGGRYFWRIDEVEGDGTTIHRGPVWEFTVSSPGLVDDFESYTDQVGHRISQAWLDSRVNLTGAQVGHLVAPFAERTIIHGGKQAMPLSYDNSLPPFYSEALREFTPAQDWTANEATTLSLWFRGDVVSFAETGPGSITMSATGTDIWSNNDQFRYAYLRLSGDGTMVARVDSIVNTDTWAKAGVMIRETLDRDSAHAFMLVTPDGRRAFQNRPKNRSGTCFSAHGARGSVSLPCWVKIERKGNQFTGYYSADGINWTKQSETEYTGDSHSPNPQTINMPPRVYIGLALTSNAEEVTTATFSHVAVTGGVSGVWQTASIGVEQPGNSPAMLYAAIEDGNGTDAMMFHPDPAAVNVLAWTEWKIPLSRVRGLDLARVKKMYIGVGRRASPTPGGTGRIYIDDICMVK